MIQPTNICAFNLKLRRDSIRNASPIIRLIFHMRNDGISHVHCSFYELHTFMRCLYFLSALTFNDRKLWASSQSVAATYCRMLKKGKELIWEILKKYLEKLRLMSSASLLNVCQPFFPSSLSLSFKHSKVDIITGFTRQHYFQWCDSWNEVSFLENMYHRFESNKNDIRNRKQS